MSFPIGLGGFKSINDPCYFVVLRRRPKGWRRRMGRRRRRVGRRRFEGRRSTGGWVGGLLIDTLHMQV